jgi:hypothetical protein
MDIKKRLLIGKAVAKKRYLSLLNKFTLNVNVLDCIVPLEESDEIIKKTTRVEVLFYKTYLFRNKNAFKKDLSHIIDFEKEFYLWIDDSYFCGLIRMPNLRAFNFDFDFDDDPQNGIIEFFYSDVEVKINYYEDSNNHYLELTIYSLK